MLNPMPIDWASCDQKSARPNADAWLSIYWMNSHMKQDTLGFYFMKRLKQ